MKLVPPNDPILLKTCEEFNFIQPPFDPIEFAKELTKFMYDNNGVGLAANQVGVLYRVFAMRGHPENFVCYNPRIVYTNNETSSMDEACLSYPGLVVKVKRSTEIRVRFMLPNADTKTETFKGMSARIFQHEMDYLNGELFFQKANRYHREVAMKKWKRGDLSFIKVKTIGEYDEHLLR